MTGPEPYCTRCCDTQIEPDPSEADVAAAVSLGIIPVQCYDCKQRDIDAILDTLYEKL